MEAAGPKEGGRLVAVDLLKADVRTAVRRKADVRTAVLPKGGAEGAEAAVPMEAGGTGAGAAG